MLWITSKEACRAGQISSCDLMHLRESGALRFEKRGNAFFYRREDVDRLAATRKKPTN